MRSRAVKESLSNRNGQPVTKGKEKSNGTANGQTALDATTRATMNGAANGNAGAVKQYGRVGGKTITTWGRAWKTGIFDVGMCACLLTFCPLMAIVFFSSCSQHGCSLSETLLEVYENPSFAMATSLISSVTMETTMIYTAWILLQVLLSLLPDVIHHVIPFYNGGVQRGSITPAGIVNEYNINGLQAWLITHLLWILNAFYFQCFSPSIISRNFGAFIIAANVFGYFLAIFSYIKGHLFPTHAADVKVSGSVVYDFMMGVEFNPRIGKYFDFKLFFNGRPGIVCWTLINFSYAWHQWERFGYVTDSMILLNILHGIYVIDFFWNESWYLKTIDICHDHFGWYLAWGDLVWLPTMYTLQGFYLSYNPVELGAVKFVAILSLGILGYVIFRTANCQKDRFRADPTNCTIWGKKASYISCTFTSSNGHQHASTLLTSGWWGIGRHMNYTGDLLGSLSYCLCCGVDHVLPYFYIIYMLILLVHRIYRDEDRCRLKYGKHWKKYRTVVPYRLLPWVY